MSTETDLRQQISRANEAERLLDQPLVKEAFRVIRQNLHEKWESTKVEHNTEREILYMQIKCLSEVEKYFNQVVRTGRIALNKLEEPGNGGTK